jgi:hypothetical protein
MEMQLICATLIQVVFTTPHRRLQAIWLYLTLVRTAMSLLLQASQVQPSMSWSKTHPSLAKILTPEVVMSRAICMLIKILVVAPHVQTQDGTVAMMD